MVDSRMARGAKLVEAASLGGAVRLGGFFVCRETADRTPAGRRRSCRRQYARLALGVRIHGGKQRFSMRSSIGLGRLISRPDQTG